MELTLPSDISGSSTLRPLQILPRRNTVPSPRIHYPVMDPIQLLTSKCTAPCAAAPVGDNGSTATAPPVQPVGGRVGEVKRVTKETNVFVKINLDGTGVADSSTGIPFLDHMLDQLASQGLFDVHVRATGDIDIDDHHTNEDVALAIGTALLHALRDRKGIHRFGDFSAPLDEALIHVSLRRTKPWGAILDPLLPRPAR